MLQYSLIAAVLNLSQPVNFVDPVVDPPTPDRTPYSRSLFRAPEGFGGHAWNTPLGKIGRLASEPVYVRVAQSPGTVTFFDKTCYESVGGLVNHVLAMKACREIDGEGYHALAEYYVDSQGFRIKDDKGRKAVMFPITYQFCSKWRGFSSEMKGDPLEQMKLCGVRLHFRSETAEQEQAIRDNEYRTAYEQTLSWMIAQHGEPEGYNREGFVFFPQLESEPHRERASDSNRHRSWYWCQPKHGEIVPKCSASIVLYFDSETGRGQVIYLTAPVWAYAQARQFGAAEGDPLYRILHGGFSQPKVDHQCLDSYLCKAPAPKSMPEDMLAKFRLTGKASNVRN